MNQQAFYVCNVPSLVLVSALSQDSACTFNQEGPMGNGRIILHDYRASKLAEAGRGQGRKGDCMNIDYFAGQIISRGVMLVLALAFLLYAPWRFFRVGLWRPVGKEC